MYRIFLFIILLSSCSRYPRDVEQALCLAGDNRAELEKVLEHYGKDPADSLKYKTACFLVGNMPGKYSEDMKSSDSYRVLFDRWNELWDERRNTGIFDSLVNQYQLQSDKKKYDDIHYIKADFLIENIDKAFEVKEKMPWGKTIPFDVFCEGVLPYRISTEPLENWRRTVLEEYGELYDSLAHGNPDIVSACLKIIGHTNIVWKHPSPDISTIPALSYSMIDRFRRGGCEERATIGLFLMRSFGIPVFYDFTPQWPDRRLGHSWISVRNEKGEYIPFAFTESKPGEPHKEGQPMAKAFRRTYGQSSGSLANMVDHLQNIPPFFRNPYFHDASPDNLPGIDLKLTVESTEEDLIYLCVFNNQKWVPVHWAGQEGNSAVFSCMGTNIVYIPAYYRDKELRPCAFPFILKSDGVVHSLKPNHQEKENLCLDRKYPLLMTALRRMEGGKFQASDKADFSDAVTLYTISDDSLLYFQEVGLNNPREYRYYRYLSPKGGECNIAELEFYGQHKKLKGKPIGTRAWAENYTFNNACDGDVLTYFMALDRHNGWVGMDFGNGGACVDKIRYLPRNDDNNIIPGQTYELLYWGDNAWVSVGGKRVAENATLYYDNVPANALFLLRNHTKGTEERIFTYEKDKQIWW